MHLKIYAIIDIKYDHVDLRAFDIQTQFLTRISFEINHNISYP